MTDARYISSVLLNVWDKFSMTRATHLGFILLCLFSICACKSAEVKSTNANSVLAQSNNEPQPPKISDFDKPPMPDDNAALKYAWQQFVADGRYRIAHINDMKFSEPAKSRINQSFSWWQVGYIFSHELAVLVVDNTRNDDARFGIVIFRPLERGGIVVSYNSHWLFRERDLSKVALDRVSGYLFVHEFAEGDSYKTCEVKWNKQTNKYLCRPVSG